MTFADSISICLRKYADFNGRASRSKFWWWTLFVLVATGIASALWYRLGNAVTIATFVPFCAVSSGRLHDTNRSGWWQLIGFIPIVGWIVIGSNPIVRTMQRDAWMGNVSVAVC